VTFRIFLPRRRRLGGHAVLVAAFACTSLLAHGAAADGPEETDLRSFRPSTDKNGTLATEGLETPGAGNLQFGMWTSFATTTLRTREANGETVRVVGPQLVIDPTIALGLGKYAAIGATTPIVVAQDSGASSLTGGQAVASQGLGDFTLTGKATALQPEKDSLSGGLGVSFLARFSFPTGDRSSFVSDSGLISELRALVTYDYVHTLTLAFTAGYRMRQKRHDILDVTIGDTIPWGFTLAFKPRAAGLDDKGHWTWMLEGHGELGAVPNKLFADSRISPVLIGPSIRYEFGGSYALFAGAETGLNDALGVPRFRAIVGFIFAPVVIDDDNDGVADSIDECPGLPGDKFGPQPGCPTHDDAGTAPALPNGGELGPPEEGTGDPGVAPADRDADGIADDVDRCPDVAETMNGYEDEDGCSEIDSDSDTFLDDVDRCPNEAEVFDGVDDEDGCVDKPAPGKPAPKGTALLVEKPKTPTAEAQVALSRKIAFDGGSPAKETASDLRALAAFVLAHPGTRLQISVQPTAKDDAANALSLQRADALAQAIVRYAHTGGAAVGVAWDPKATPPKGTNVLVVVAKDAAPAEGSPAK
jgi:OmpA-OmpF porin, OOP family